MDTLLMTHKLQIETAGAKKCQVLTQNFWVSWNAIKQKHSKCFKASRNFTFNDAMVSDGVGDFLINQSPKNDSITSIVMKNGIFEDWSSENEVLYSTMDLYETGMPLNLREVL